MLKFSNPDDDEKKKFNRVISQIRRIDEAELQALKNRINIAMGVILFLVSILLVRLWFLQILRGPEYLKLSENNRIRLEWVSAPRGNILDRTGRPLISNRPYFNITWTKEDSANPDETVRRMAKILKVDTSEILKRIREAADYPRHVPVLLKEDVDWPTLVYIENHQYDLPGIHVEALPSRKYQFNNLASHLVGYLGNINKNELAKYDDNTYLPSDQIGKLGLEKLYEPLLRGEKGRRYVEVDVHGFEQRQIMEQEPLPGEDLKLTIDIDLQKTAEEALAGKAGAVVVMEVNSGKLLAMTSSPPLELREFIGGISTKNWQGMLNNPLHPFINKSIQGQYPPGSTYKIVTALAGLSENAITPETTFNCIGYMKLYGRRYHCWKRAGHGKVNLKKALRESCDVYFYQVGMKVGVDKLAKYANSLGLGHKTGIKLAHEKSGLTPTKDWKRRKYKLPWQEGETMSTAIGQGFNLVTPLQVCLMTATLANGGTRYRPQLISEILDETGKTKTPYKAIIDGHALGTPQSLAYIRAGLIAAVNEKHGTGGVAKLDSILVGGKTGTAQVVKLAQYRHSSAADIPYKYRDHAWFTCFAPADKPEIAITVLVEHGRHGGSGAGPVARAILEEYFKDRLKKP